MRGRWAVVVVAVAAVALGGCSSSSKSGAASTASTPAPATPTTTVPSTSAVPGAPSTSAAAAPAPAGPAVVHQKLTHFRLTDVSFVGTQAWALGGADCLNGQGTCDAIEYSGDSGRTWRSAPSPEAGIGDQARPCGPPCVARLRFATSRIGYAYSGAGDALSAGSGALFMTTDGGTTWKRQSGGAEALETLGGNVIRVVAGAGCPPGCTYRVELAPIGGTAWHTVALPGPRGLGDSVALARAGRYSYLLVGGNPAGGANEEKSVLWSSATNGQSWVNRGEPCPQTDREVDSSRLSAAPDGSVTVLCTARTASGATFTATSTNGGASFHAGARSALGGAGVDALGAASATTVLVSSDETYRSTDGGKHFARLSADAGSSPGQVSWIGFASGTLGHAFRLGRNALWTTTDAGAGWTKHTFG